MTTFLGTCIRLIKAIIKYYLFLSAIHNAIVAVSLNQVLRYHQQLWKAIIVWSVGVSPLCS